MLELKFQGDHIWKYWTKLKMRIVATRFLKKSLAK